MARDYYGTLGLARNATDQEIKRAYRRLARELHPDVNSSQDAQGRFREVAAAYEVLSDEKKRRIVDLGADPLDNGARTRQRPFAGFGDIIDAFFSAAAGARDRGRRGRVRPGRDALVRVELTLEECATGVIRDITVDIAVLCDQCRGAGTASAPAVATCDSCNGRGEIHAVRRSFLEQTMDIRPCSACDGHGEVSTDSCRKCAGDGRMSARRTISAHIPGGVGDGTRIRLPGQGEVGPGGGPAGDLYIEVVELPHDVFVRQGRDLHCVIAIPMTTAALGETVPLETLVDGDHQLRVEPGTQPGATLIVRGKGLPSMPSTRLDESHREGRGDLHVHVDVRVPTELDGAQRWLLRRLAELRRAA